MGNPLQVDNKVTSNGLTLTRNYFVSTRHNHCTWHLDNIFNTFLKHNKGRGRRHCPWALTSSLPSETEILSEMICSQLRSTCGTSSECSKYGMPYLVYSALCGAHVATSWHAALFPGSSPQGGAWGRGCTTCCYSQSYSAQECTSTQQDTRLPQLLQIEWLSIPFTQHTMKLNPKLTTC